MKNIYTIITFTALILLSSCGKEEKQQEKLIRPVRYQEVGYLGGDKIRSFSGTAQTDKIIKLSFRSAGIINSFTIKLGQKVKKGQLLAKLDNVNARLSYEQSLTQLNSAQSQMNLAKLSLNRVRSLYEKGSSSLSDFESAKNAYKTAQESYQSAKRGVSIQQEQIKFGYLYAPENGIIAAVASEIDENVNAGQTIATLNAGKDMEIALGLPESIITRVKEGMVVEVSFTAIPGELFKAKVTEVAPAVDANTATYPIKVILNNTSDKIRSGMAANVTFDLGEQKEAGKVLVVPANAVGEDSKGNFVFVLQDNAGKTIVKKQQVTIGNLTSEGFEIKQGLQAKQRIATAGLQTLLDGQEVKIQ